MRHLIDPADFTLEETLRLMDLADRGPGRPHP